jgi:hypothetical protein
MLDINEGVESKRAALHFLRAVTGYSLKYRKCNDEVRGELGKPDSTGQM